MSAHQQRTLFNQSRAGIASSRQVARLRVIGGLLFLTLSASLAAETHFCIGGDLDALTPAAVAACQAKMLGVRDQIKQRGAPSGWHFVVVCDEPGWREYTRFSGNAAGLMTGVGYSTDPQLHWTFLRGSMLDTQQPETTATVLTTAMEGIPTQRNLPEHTPAHKQAPQYSIAMRNGSEAQPVTP